MLDKLFDKWTKNLGKKLKNIARSLFEWGSGLGIIVWVILLIVKLVNGFDFETYSIWNKNASRLGYYIKEGFGIILPFIIALPCIILAAFIISLGVYIFGIFVECAEMHTEYLWTIKRNIPIDGSPAPMGPAATMTQNKKTSICSKCGHINEGEGGFCEKCGTKLN